MNAQIVVLAGDGVGPEVTAEAVRVLDQIAATWGHQFGFDYRPIGGDSIDRTGVPLSGETLAACKASDAILLGAVGGPQWDRVPDGNRPERGLLALRKELGLFANLRPVRPHPSVVSASPLKEERVRGVDLIVVRELTGGLYFGTPRFRRQIDDHLHAVDTMEYHDYEIRRVVDLACRLARGRRNKVTSVDKSNVLETSKLWREVATKTASHYPDVALEHMLVDTAAMRIVFAAQSFDVLVTENMFGDILTDEAAVLTGSMGMLPSASLGEKGPGVYEPIHGSAPDIAGRGIANPIGTILSAAMLLRHSLSLPTEAAAVEDAVDRSLTQGCKTIDLGGTLTTREMTDQILKHLEHK